MKIVNQIWSSNMRFLRRTKVCIMHCCLHSMDIRATGILHKWYNPEKSNRILQQLRIKNRWLPTIAYKYRLFSYKRSKKTNSRIERYTTKVKQAICLLYEVRKKKNEKNKEKEKEEEEEQVQERQEEENCTVHYLPQ